jgi:tetratricopeptide (TPR) repeat protein
MVPQSIVIFAILALAGEPLSSAADSPDPETWPRLSLSEARRLATNVDDPFRRAQILEQTAAVAIGLGDAVTACGMLREAFDAARAITDRSLRDLALKEIAVSQSRCADVSAALRTMEQISDRGTRDTVSSALVDALVSAGQLGSALSVARGIYAPVTISHALRKIAVAQARGERFADARALADEIPDDMLRALAVADIGAFHANIGNEQALETARSIARRVRPAAQREAALGYVAAVQAQSGNVQDALSTADSIKGPATRAYALARIADVLLQAGDPVQADELLNRAVALTRTARPSETTAIVLCEIAATLIVAGHKAGAISALEMAFSSAASVRKHRWDTTIFEIIARAQARAGAVRPALATAEKIPASGARALVIHDILAARAEAGGAAEAVEIARSFRDPQVEIAGLFGIVGAQAAGGDIAGANRSLKLILEAARSTADPDYRAHSLGAVAAAQVRMGDTIDGWPIFQEALAEAATLADPYARALAHVNLSDPFTQR